ncbi:MAG: sulfatase [Bacteroidales bacterium]|nr:sulfatase [Bacteroidales bacterium]
MRIYKWLILSVLLFALHSCEPNDKTLGIEKVKPNIIFIMSDDHATTAISAYGNSVNQTPNIDRLAEEGMMFQNSFCTNAICAPVRAVILTGKYSHINGHIDNSITFDGSQQTFPKILQQHHYQTVMIGKWHLKSEPTGFDYWSILPGQGSYYNPDFIEMGKKRRYEGYVTNIITEKTVDWLAQRDTSKPFCLMMHHKAPHRTWMPDINHINDFDSIEIPIPPTFFDDYENRGTAANTQKMSIWKDMYLGYDLKLTKENSTELVGGQMDWSRTRMNMEQRALWDSAFYQKNQEYYRRKPEGKALALWKYRRYMEDYLATIQSVDESVGAILDYLEENGLSENTVVVYTSDQGFYLGEHGWFDKRFMYEESLKIPLLIRYPKEIPAGQISKDIVLNLDFASTFLDYAGVDIPEEMQGVSVRNILKGNETEDWRQEMYYHYYEYPRSNHNVKRHYGIRTHRYKLIHYYYDIDEWELFDLMEDPHELKNLYAHHDYAGVVSNLKLRLKGLREKYKDNNQDSFLPSAPNKSVKHKALGAKVYLKYPYADKYSAGGAFALTDGKISADNLAQTEDRSVWQGFEGQDVIATLECQKEIDFNTISVGFMQNTDAWIFSPDWVEFYNSSDNKTFRSIGKVNRPISIKSTSQQRVSYDIQHADIKAKYIRIIAKNVGQCPQWHKGEGYKAWLFVDEVIVN